MWTKAQLEAMDNLLDFIMQAAAEAELTTLDQRIAFEDGISAALGRRDAADYAEWNGEFNEEYFRLHAWPPERVEAFKGGYLIGRSIIG